MASPWCRGRDSNPRRLSQQIYSLPCLTASLPLRDIDTSCQLRSYSTDERPKTQGLIRCEQAVCYNVLMHISWFDIGPGTIVCVLLVLLLARSVWRLGHVFRRRRDTAYGMELPYRVFIVIVTLILAALPIYIEFRQQQTNLYATSVARKVTGDDKAYARCQRGMADMLDTRSIGYSGWVEPGADPNRANLTSQICGNFSAWLRSDKHNATEQQIFALHVVIHESVHLTGEHNEAETEYKASELYEDVAVSLGAPRAEAKRMVSFYISQINPRLPEGYRVDYVAREKAKQEALEKTEAEKSKSANQ